MVSQCSDILLLCSDVPPTPLSRQREGGKKGVGVKVDLGIGPTDPSALPRLVCCSGACLLSVGELWGVEASQRLSTQAPLLPGVWGGQCSIQGKLDKPSPKQFCKPQKICPGRGADRYQ